MVEKLEYVVLIASTSASASLEKQLHQKRSLEIILEEAKAMPKEPEGASPSQESP